MAITLLLRLVFDNAVLVSTVFSEPVREKDDYLVEVLVDLGFVSTDQVTASRPEAQRAGVGLVDFMLANKLIQAKDVSQAEAAYLGAERISKEIRDDGDFER